MASGDFLLLRFEEHKSLPTQFRPVAFSSYRASDSRSIHRRQLNDVRWLLAPHCSSDSRSIQLHDPPGRPVPGVQIRGASIASLPSEWRPVTSCPQSSNSGSTHRRLLNDVRRRQVASIRFEQHPTPLTESCPVTSGS